MVPGRKPIGVEFAEAVEWALFDHVVLFAVQCGAGRLTRKAQA
jgi:hypothetical protein